MREPWCVKCGTTGWASIGTYKMVEFKGVDGKEYVAEDWKIVGNAVCDCQSEKAVRLRNGGKVDYNYFLENRDIGDQKIKYWQDPRQAAAEDHRQKGFDDLVNKTAQGQKIN